MADPQKRIAQLRNEIAEHDRLYYKEAQPKIDDQAYDRLKAELAQLEAANPEFDFDAAPSPTQSVGDDRLEAFEIENLRDEITHHNELYYKKAAPVIDDKAYDRLIAKLARLETAHPELSTENSPTQTVGDDRLEAFESYTHRMPMFSLGNTYSMEELIEFGRRLERRFSEQTLNYIVEPKIDGVAISLTYERGKFIRAVTRGNGAEGDDITQNVLSIKGIPSKIENAPDIIEIRGEIYMLHEEFERINTVRVQEGLNTFKNPRNLAAGTIKLLDPAEAKTRQLNIVLYGIGACEPARYFSHQAEVHEKLKAWGFSTLEKTWLVHNIEEAWTSIKQLDELRKNFTYPTDGAVVKLNEFRLQKEAGFTSKSPRWAISYKFDPERAITQLKEIRFQIGRGGTVTPVANLDSVELAGTSVSSATLHNEDEIIRKDIRPGDSVLVQKAGEIIPQILRVNLDKRTNDSSAFDFQQQLDELGITAQRSEKEIVWRVIDKDDSNRKQRALQHFASRVCMDIENLGTAIIEQLVTQKLALNIADLYTLKKEDLLKLDKLAEKSANNLLKAIESSKTRELWQLIHGFGIPQIGKQTAKDLESEFKNLDDIINATKERLIQVAGLGQTGAASICNWFNQPENQEMISRLRSFGLNFESSANESQTGTLSGKTIVLTGTLPTLNRNQATELIEKAGGRTSSSVSKKTDYLLAGEAAGSKYNKAVKLGIPILSEEKFLSLIS
ncbi:MAG: DNA ligase (NAD(+)) LigA [Puniceicoccaceae bacterium]|nr:DNA ligase (NAD(+)) LigA [Puniceicoccaceae bacterium]|tara:strand:- start:5324 stop:7513 length:2190 start_codon:yes stop_codon:yes gene_type:complete